MWFFGSSLEDERGGRWLAEYFLWSAIGGGLLASLLSLAHVPGIGPGDSVYGLWAVVMALLVAFARRNPNAELRLYFVLRVKAKYLVAIFLAFYVASALFANDRFSAVTGLCVALCGYLFLRLVPRRGLSFAASEWWFGMRNAFYRRKRQQAAKKFTVYMKKQGRDVNVDSGGKRDPNDRDPNDKRWMN